ncbi:ATP-binding protein [Chitinophaga sancti]|uniref:ATP-binding protein n=1 Tax=Chitinophaga sancti TaxID=1004 RepID=A0A1K1RQ40_9BACT|nr:ATP-binding protein [Chitinophaga sancti]WQD62555.1 ATP-binding protein [Chitinophaga sancti]WQG91876.1 ATP-binding protein [Chitinophaga sancti]SFW73941.1 Predicted kinase [Chitinophaga sancti]
MEAIIFCGIQASGKSTFYKEHFFNSHARISLDLLNTRNREDIFLHACLNTQMPFVVDNTNPTRNERQKYIALAKHRHYTVKCYYFQTGLQDALSRNNTRHGKALIPEFGIKATLRRFETPELIEGFDAIYYVRLENNSYSIQNYSHEI